MALIAGAVVHLVAIRLLEQWERVAVALASAPSCAGGRGGDPLERVAPVEAALERLTKAPSCDSAPARS